ncbi:hypothetical protein RSOL_355240 [Rhizoctonia solani AG-3 Rhs1AP]|uniref:Uncharacterized protein n=1 Tax=Rhizoctonia solani AG-3 Rhs1AP TaxID=1086054 RepID=X8JCD6_9AGAM|nr:hypothetical protein RSOL_355240 [Rhizoctonia solani AG-3 Rhs1AP]
MFRWAYFITREEMVNRYKERGGKLGTYNPKNATDIEHARRAILKFLLPGPVRVWDGYLGDSRLGFVFFVGKSVPEPREAFGRELASRCYQMFRRSPDQCKSIRDSENMWWNLYSRDGTKQLLKLGEFLGSDTEGDMYPLTPEQIAMLTSSGYQ